MTDVRRLRGNPLARARDELDDGCVAAGVTSLTVGVLLALETIELVEEAFPGVFGDGRECRGASDICACLSLGTRTVCPKM
jgi:hypothetical protein